MDQAQEKSSPVEAGDSYKVLVIDDDVELCRMMKEYFARLGYEVDFTHDGNSGLARALGGKYDLVILDGMLPGLDGLEVLRQLRRRSSIPVIMLTARTGGKTASSAWTAVPTIICLNRFCPRNCSRAFGQ
jgi:two-component system response regulator CpxR